MTKKDKIHGALIGAAIGDALGFIIEKKTSYEARIFVTELQQNSLTTFKQRTFPTEYPFGQYSDDTQFSLILMKSIIECKTFDPQNYLQKLLKEYQSKTLIGLGKNTRNIFTAYLNKQDVSVLTNISSNGSLMRSWPIGFVYHNKRDIFKYSKLQSKLTHNSDEAILSCQIMASLINFCLINAQITQKEFAKEVKKYINNDFLFLNIQQFEEYVLSEYYHPEWDLIPPGAMVTLKAVLHSVYNNLDSFEDAMFAGLSLGGDTDSVAALIGALMGTYLGFNKIPPEWVKIPRDPHFGTHVDLLNVAENFMESLVNFQN